MPALEGMVLNGLVAGYAGRPISRVANLTVARGQAAILSGASGTGKTTLLLAIAGLAERLAGEIRIGGEDVSELSTSRRDRHRGEHIGLIFQDLHLVPGLSALDNMLLAPFATGSKPNKVRARALLDRLGVAHRADARAETLSRGEGQRLAIARALLMNPQLILADEPTASLDDQSCAAVLELLIEATRDSGAALIVATHDVRVRAHIPHAVKAETAR